MHRLVNMAKCRYFQESLRVTQILNEPARIGTLSTGDADFVKGLFQLLRVQMVVVVPSEEERNETRLQFLVLSLLRR